MSNEPKPYLLDGEPIGWRELIKAAIDLGWEHKRGLTTSSNAAAFLRKTGHDVGHNPAF